MRIAIFTDTYPPYVNGVSTSCFNLAKVLKAHGHDVLVVAPRPTKGKLELVDGVLYIPGAYLKRYYGMTLVMETKVQESTQAFLRSRLGLAHCQFYYILVTKAEHNTSSNSRDWKKRFHPNVGRCE